MEEKKSKLVLVNFRGQVFPVTEEEYDAFISSIREGEWD